MAITGWGFEEIPSGLGLVYESHVCPDPVTHKTILSFVSQIEKEVHAVNYELHLQQGLLHAHGKRYQIHLPREVRPLVTEAQDPQSGRKLYIYQDIHFRLDQDEIQKLLMGTALYGDPGLCIRELLQNALDALELRELRLMTPKKARHEPVDDLDGEELRVELTWGGNPEKGEFIRVTDWGVGMTRRVIQEYFTKVGKSYYKSADYRQEQAALARAGLVTSPISLFGIGILSCFMIAERMLVRTCPGDHDDGERQRFDVTISGPASLFWLKPGTLEHQGTEITLYLKRGFQLQHNAQTLLNRLRVRACEGGQVVLTQHNAQTLLNRLRKHFGYPIQTDEDPKTSSEIEEETGSKDQSKTILDLAFLAAAHVVWPRYPVVVRAPGEKEPVIRIDDRFHPDVLAPIDPAKVVAKAKEWDFPESCVGQPCWTWWEWHDEGHDLATGSRVRLWFPAHRKNADPPGQGQAKVPTQDFPLDPPDDGLCRYHDLAAFVETQLEDGLRARVLVQGMHVEESDLATQQLEIAPAVGTRLWVDLRGGAAPGLTTDRRRMLMPENDEIKDPALWEEEIHRSFRRCLDYLTSSLQGFGLSTWHNVATGFRWTGTDLPQPPVTCPDWSVSRVVVGELLPASHESIVNKFWYLNAKLFQDGARVRDLVRDTAHDFVLTLDLDRDTARDLAFGTALGNAFVRDLDRHTTLALTRGSFRHRALALDLDLARDLADARVFSDLALVSDLDLAGMTLGSIFQEGFRPDLSRSWPPLGLQGLRGQVGNAALAAPWRVIFTFEESDGRMVRDADPDGTRCRRLIKLGYNLVFPMVAIPLGRLRQGCPKWRTDRRVQPLGVAPFLFPEFHYVWPKLTLETPRIFGVPKIYALCPRFELWDKRFDDWSDEDWKTCGRSVLWKITTGRVLWADGAHPIEKMPEIGRPAPEYFDFVL